MTNKELYNAIIELYASYYWSNLAKNNEDHEGLDRWLEEVAPQEEELFGKSKTI